MNRAVPVVLWLALLSGIAEVAYAQSEGQADLDQATRLRVNAERPQDIQRIIELCESALSKGLDENSTAFAKRLLVSALWQHGSHHAGLIFDQQRRPARLEAIRAIAVNDLEKLVQLDDEFREAHVLLARLYALHRDGRKKARSAIDRALELSADDRQRSEALLYRARLRDKAEDRLADLDAAIKADPTHTKAWQLRAAVHREGGRIEEAVHDLEKLLENDRDNVPVLQALAEALANLKRYELAHEHVEKAIELAPNEPTNYILRAGIYQEQQELEKAIADLDKALELEPSSNALLMRARLHYFADDLPTARADVEQYLRIKPDSLEAVLLRSLIAAADKRFREAISDLQQVVARVPNRVDLKLQLATFYNYDQRPSKAIKLTTEIIEDDDANWRALRTRADALLSVGKHAEAIDDYSAALELQPEDDGILNNLAWVLATSPVDDVRDGTRAIVLAKKACEVTNFERAHILSTLAAAYAEAGDFERAVKWSTDAVEKGKTDLKEQLEQLQQELESYKQRKPWREMQEVKDKPDPPRRVIET